MRRLLRLVLMLTGILFALGVVWVCLVGFVRHTDHWKFLAGRSPYVRYVERIEDWQGETCDCRTYEWQEASSQVVSRAKPELAAAGFKLQPDSKTDYAGWVGPKECHVFIKESGRGTVNVEVLEPVPDDLIFKIREQIERP